MDLYKLISLILILNIGLTVTEFIIIEKRDWDDFESSSSIARLLNLVEDIQGTVTDEDQMLTEQGENKQDYNGGISISIIAIKVIYGTFMVVFGGLIVNSTLIMTANLSQSLMLSIIATVCMIFNMTLYIWLGMKLWTWYYAKDTQ